METAIEKRREESPTTATSIKKKSILLVEDDIGLEDVWHLICRNLDYKCEMEWVTSAAAAERSIWKKRSRNEHYDIILCDIFLSGSKTGIDLVHTFPQESSDFIFTSGVAPDKLKKLLTREPRTYHVLHKPLDPNLCIHLLNQVLQEREEQKR